VLECEVRFLKGVGPKRAELLARLGLRTVRDLVFHLPRDYEDRRTVARIADLKAGQKAVVAGKIVVVNFRPTRGQRGGILQVVIDDGTGLLELVWFNVRYAWQNSFPVGKALTAYGEAGFYRGAVQMAMPTCQVGVTPAESEDFGAILPVYPLTEGISQKVVRKLTRAALEAGAAQVQELLPPELLAKKGFPPVSDALLPGMRTRLEALCEAARARRT